MLAYRSFGHFWCPMCFCRREFIAEDESVTDAGKAECEECQYQFGNKTDELHVEGSGTNQRYVTKVSPVLAASVVEKARERRREQHRTSMLSSGVRLEDLRGKRKTADS